MGDFAKAATRSQARAAPLGCGRERESMRILLVEDNLSLAEGLTALLRQSGYAVDVVHDGASAEALAAAESSIW